MADEQMPLGMGDLIKGEALWLSRTTVAAPAGTKAGALVKYPPRGEGHYLIALSDEQKGRVVVQPWNCVIDLSAIKASELSKTKVKPDGGAETPLTAALLQKMGDPYGIAYIGAPKP